ncbi:MAG: glucose 1-dehydrogenase [Proteobacteria bacterium]|nr:glucose 1-dehydrogenase [Pseudomonadota bacterium]MDA1331791.1 glucose 1-dehydrogenase [Pseudomonadota bacterium]
MEFGLKGRVALITGAGRGLGLAQAQALADEGVKVMINDIDAERAQKAATEVGERGVEALSHACDSSDESAVTTMVERAVNHFGRLDILVNNAGLPGAQRHIDEMDMEVFDRAIRVHLRSTVVCSKHAIRQMKIAGWGRIVNLSSSHFLSGGRAGICDYTAAKAAISGLTQNLAKEVAAHGITVNALAPGFILTDLLTAAPKSIHNTIVSQNPTGRFCKAEEVGALVAFLCSSQAAYINGATIPMDGGRREFFWD